MKKEQIKGIVQLLLATLIWGCAFVAQSVGMDYIEPFTFQAVRCFLAVLFLIQLATAVILGNCYDKTEPSLHRKILIALGVLHGILMLGDMSLLLWLGSFWGCFILSIVLFLLTGIYLMIQRQRWQGIVVALFSLIAWIQPVFFFVVQQ